MSKEQMISAIRERNRSASVEYLVHFDETALRSYLDRLTRVLGHRGPQSVWVRDTTERCVVSRVAA
jgi:hypothetical protein